MTGRFENQVEQLVDEFRARRPLRAGSLIITVYGDAIAPRGGTVWLGSLIRLLEPFGLSSRLTRTTVSRLAKDNWLVSQPVGRKSFYSLTDSGRRRFEVATRRIYTRPRDAWDKHWCMVILPAGQDPVRDTLRKELGWQGFGPLRPGIMAHPAPDIDALDNTLRDLDVEDDVIVMRAESQRSERLAPLRRMVAECWSLDTLEAGYAAFLARFQPILKTAQRIRRLAPKSSLHVRILLIHEYRKVLLRDPQLPPELLHARWPGAQAYRLCQQLYAQVQAPAERYLSSVLETADGPLPEAAAYFYDRFGGLSGAR